MRLRVIVPQQGQISGGRVFNTALITALRRRGWLIDERPVAGAWPWPSEVQRQSLQRELTADPDVPLLVDGLVGAACPEEMAQAVAVGARIVLLVHLPLPAETGLKPAEAATLSDRERRAVHAATAVATTSHWAADDVERRYGRPVEGVLVPGVDPAPLAVGSDPPLLLMVAALTPMKNHVTAVAALAEVADLPWRAALVGPHRDAVVVDGVRRGLLEAGLADRVELSGEVPRDALDGVWERTDLLLLPSLADTYGLVVTEALARGIPAVVSSTTGAVEALTGGRTPTEMPIAGALADPADPGEWATVLRDWLVDRGCRGEWRQRAWARRKELRAWADTADDLERFLQRLKTM